MKKQLRAIPKPKGENDERDVPYQSLIKVILFERIAQELSSQPEATDAK